VAFGLAEMVRMAPMAYNAVRYAGAAYLVYPGVRTCWRWFGDRMVKVAFFFLTDLRFSGTMVDVVVALAANSVGDAIRKG
jgi:hypothetical protein